MFVVLVSVIVIGGIIVIVNAYQAGQWKNTTILKGILFLLPLITVIIGGLILLTALTESDTTGLDEADLNIVGISRAGSISIFIVSMILGIAGIGLIRSRQLRVIFQRIIIRSDGLYRRYHPDAVIHTLALLLMGLASVNTVGNFVLAGGIEGIATEISTISASDLLSNLAMYIAFSLLGVGLFIRRDFQRSLRRLGIRLPRNSQWIAWSRDGMRYLVIGAFVGFGMFWLQIGMMLIWQTFASPETIAAQSAASQALFAALSGSLWLGFLVAFTAGVGEELLFRGALQPIFGNVVVSIFFVLLHSQYLLTPASLIIFIVSLIFGFLRDYTTTPAAMMAHFVYNFTPFILIALLNQWGISLEGFIF
ncbi:MAG: CPBP family intramembrane glutamic endopeptidase [Anaerolineae bacterium]